MAFCIFNKERSAVLARTYNQRAVFWQRLDKDLVQLIVDDEGFGTTSVAQGNDGWA
jgi:hypothetical protein